MPQIQQNREGIADPGDLCWSHNAGSGTYNRVAGEAKQPLLEGA